MRRAAKPPRVSLVSRGNFPTDRLTVSQAENPREADINEASKKLNEGLKNCRSVIENYRFILRTQPSNDADDSKAAPNDNQQQS